MTSPANEVRKLLLEEAARIYSGGSIILTEHDAQRLADAVCDRFWVNFPIPDEVLPSTLEHPEQYLEIFGKYWDGVRDQPID